MNINDAKSILYGTRCVSLEEFEIGMKAINASSRVDDMEAKLQDTAKFLGEQKAKLEALIKPKTDCDSELIKAQMEIIHYKATSLGKCHLRTALNALLEKLD